jgi:hypothetical protein
MWNVYGIGGGRRTFFSSYFSTSNLFFFATHMFCNVTVFLGPFQLHLLVGPRLSPSAAEAASAGQIWEMFFTEEILNIIVENTNR